MNLRRTLLAATAATTALAVGGLAVPSVRALMSGSAADAATGKAATTSFLVVDTTGTYGKRGTDDFRPTRDRLIRVDSDGTRRTLFAVKRSAAGGGLMLLDTAGSTALVARQGTWDQGTVRLLAIDTVTGAVRHRLTPVPRSGSALLEPDGSGVVELQSPKGQAAVPLHFVRVAWDGTTTRLEGTTPSQAWLAADGDIVVPSPGVRRTVRVLDGATGALVATYSTGAQHCDPARTWDATHVLMTCGTLNNPFAQLKTLDPATGRLSAVTRRHPHSDMYFGDQDARVTPLGTFVLEDGPCGTVFFTKQRSDGSLKRLLPHVRGNVTLVGTVGRLPVTLHESSCDGYTQRHYLLASYDPRTAKEHVIASFGPHEVVNDVVPVGERRAVRW